MKSSGLSIRQIGVGVFCMFFLLTINFPGFSFGKSSLKNKDVIGLEVIFNENGIIIPGSTIHLGVIVKLKNNEEEFTRGFSGGKLFWNNFEINVIGGTYSRGKVWVSKADYMVRSGEVVVNVKSKHQPNVSYTKTINLNYEKEVKIIYNNDFCKAPGEKIEVGIQSKFDNGLTASTKGLLGGDLNLDHYKFEFSGCELKNKKLFIVDDINQIYNHTIGFRVSPKTNPEIEETFEVKLDYVKEYTFYSSGMSGMNGFTGFSGSSGLSGAHGKDGEDGDHGRHGSRGPDFHVYADAYYDTILQSDLLYVYVENLFSNKKNEFLINPYGGSIKIISEGGDGGHGGDGGDGGNGGNGKDGEKRIKKIQVNDSTEVEKVIYTRGQKGGYGGNGGYGGCGGDGGDGGDIHIDITPNAQKYAHLIRAYSQPGSGGYGGDGGHAGNGGNGGDGNPDGSNGLNGAPGRHGNNGWDGRPGGVFFYQMEDEGNNIP